MLKGQMPPTSTYRTSVMEGWLNEQAARGLLLREFSPIIGLAKFQESEPQQLIYCFLPYQKNDLRTAEEWEKAYLEQGWQYVCNIRKDFHVYQSDHLRAEKPELDAAVHASCIKRIRRDLVSLLICHLVLFGMVLANFGALYKFISDTVYDQITLMPPYLCALVLLVLCVLLVLLKDVGNLSAWRHRYKEKPANNHAGLQRLLHWGTPIVLALMLLSVLDLSLHNPIHFYPSAHVEQPLPLVQLDLFEPGSVYYAPASIGPSTDVAHIHSLLIPDEVRIMGTAMLSDQENWASLEYISHPDLSLTFCYYRLRFASMADSLLQDEIMRGGGKENQVKEIQMPGFEEVYEAVSPYGYQFLWAKSGDVVITLVYQGTSDVTAHLEELAGIVQSYRNI